MSFHGSQTPPGTCITSITVQAADYRNYYTYYRIIVCQYPHNIPYITLPYPLDSSITGMIYRIYRIYRIPIYASMCLYLTHMASSPATLMPIVPPSWPILPGCRINPPIAQTSTSLLG